MGKKVKFNLDFVISDEKKEVALRETENTELATNESENAELMASNNRNIIIPRSSKRKRRKKLFTIGLVIAGMVIVFLGGYALGNQSKDVKPMEIVVDNREEIVQEESVSEESVPEESVVEDVIYDSTPVVQNKGPKGEMSERLANFPVEDEIVRAIMKRGYYYELDNVVEDGIFKMELVAATGETYTPILLMNIHVDDEELIAQYDEIEVHAYCLDQTTYDTDIRSYGQWNAYGVQDEVDPHVYHVALPSGIFLSTSIEPVIFDMTKIRLGSETTGWTEYDVSLKETLNIPYDVAVTAFYPGYEIPNTSYKFQSDTIPFELTWIDIGYYSSNLEFSYDVEDSLGEAPNYLNDYRQWYKFIEDVILEINGVEYRVDSRYSTTINKKEDKKEFYVWAPFPGVVEDEIKSMIVKYRDTEYKIR